MTFYRKRVFPALAGLLWAAFLTLDLTGWGDSTWVKFGAICLCCVTALLGAKTTDGKLVAVAMFFTVAADWFLLVVDRYYELGLGLFIIVQLIYAYRLCLHRDKLILPFFLFLRIALGLGGFFHFAFEMQWVNALSAFYFCNLWINAMEAMGGPGGSQWAWLTYDVTRNRLRSRFGWGLWLFFFCDICVGAYNLKILTSVTWWACWAFYLPSQVLIVLSQELEKGDLDEKRF